MHYSLSFRNGRVKSTQWQGNCSNNGQGADWISKNGQDLVQADMAMIPIYGNMTTMTGEESMADSNKRKFDGKKVR